MASLALGRPTQQVFDQSQEYDVIKKGYHADFRAAECVSEETQKPLISLTSADIGTSPDLVERRLLKWFKLAKIWSAILLLDEADVFLERRSATDLVRNNLVAIFLRTLEYYQGILFLTTNRIGTFDEAFISRIDVPIYFPALTNEQRTRIWSTFFRKLEEERQDKIRVAGDVKYYVGEDRDLLDLEWNGREIRSSQPSPSSFPVSEHWLTLLLSRLPDCRCPGGNRRPWEGRDHDHGQEETHCNGRCHVKGVQALPERFASAKCRRPCR